MKSLVIAEKLLLQEILPGSFIAARRETAVLKEKIM